MENVKKSSRKDNKNLPQNMRGYKQSRFQKETAAETILTKKGVALTTSLLKSYCVHSTKKETAAALGVPLSTFERYCRRLGMATWDAALRCRGVPELQGEMASSSGLLAPQAFHRPEELRLRPPA